MAAIAYVTDEKMIEYHRFKGNDTIVFWRLSEKNFSDFKTGDLLFFLAKDNETKQTKEKGLIGYGCYKNSQSMSIDNLFKKYGDLTGYQSKNELLEAIKKSNKGKNLPRKINCLLLENVFFFQSPIYLSRLGFELKNNLESFTYLDKQEGKLTLDILKQVENVGLDYWNRMLNEDVESIFYRQLFQYQISTILSNLRIDNKVDNKYRDKICCLYQNVDFRWVNQQKNCFLKNDILYLIYQTKQQKQNDDYYRMIGQYYLIKEQLKKNGIELKINIITNSRFNQIQRDYLKENNIEWKHCEAN